MPVDVSSFFQALAEFFGKPVDELTTQFANLYDWALATTTREELPVELSNTKTTPGTAKAWTFLDLGGPKPGWLWDVMRLAINGNDPTATVTGNVIADVSANGIQLLGPADPADPRAFIADVRIENNLVTRVGAEYHGAVGIFSDWALRTVIAHNELRDLPYTAVSAGIGFELAELPSTGGYTIRENHVVDVMRDRFDGGGFYVLSNNPGSTVARNFVHRVPGGWPMYLEAGGKGWSIVENVFSEGQLPAPFDGWLVMNSLTDSPAPRDNEVAHNFADTDHIYTDSDGVAFGLNSVHDNEIHPDRDWPLDAQDIIAAAGLEPPYRTLAPSF